MGTTADRYNAVKAELAQYAVSVGRPADAVRLICVSKQATLEQVEEVYAAGGHAFGENRIDVMEPKALALPDAEWHFIGNIQYRKIGRIVQHASLIHSVCHDHQLAGIEKAAAGLDKVQDILLEVNVSGEESKDGLAPSDVSAFLAQAEACTHVRVRGLMTMAPQGDEARARQTFEGLARLREALIAEQPGRADTFTELSMGMSEDWRAAVAAGATMVRLGRAVFSSEFVDAQR